MVKYLVDGCKKFTKPREELISKLLKLGLGIDLYFYGFKELVNNLQFNEDIYNLTQINRINLLNLIKLFINEIRENYLKITTFNVSY